MSEPGERDRAGAVTARFGAPHLHLRETGSTNDRARELAELGAPSGTIVTAERQSAGRGRRGRVWSAPPGAALLFSALLRPLASAAPLLPLAVAVAVCEAAEQAAGVECEIKWPNDVWLERRKLAGVLIEARVPDWAVIGIGVNVAAAPDDPADGLRWPAASLAGRTSVEEVREAVSVALGRWARAGDGAVLAAFRARDALAGRQVRWDDAARRETGRAVGIDERGNLLVVTEDGRELSLGAGEVQLRLERA